MDKYRELVWSDFSSCWSVKLPVLISTRFRSYVFVVKNWIDEGLIYSYFKK